MPLNLVTNVTILLSWSNCEQEGQINTRMGEGKGGAREGGEKGRKGKERKGRGKVDRGEESEREGVELTNGDALHHTLVSYLYKLATAIVNVSHKECLVQIAMETTMIDTDVNCNNGTEIDVMRTTTQTAHAHHCRYLHLVAPSHQECRDR